MTENRTPEQKTTRRRKVQAVLAGGLVLGVGAAVTLAAWNDSEFAEGLFGSASFNLEGSTDGSDYDDHDTADEAAQLTFDADNMTPGQTVYAPFYVRLDADTTINGTVEASDGIGVVSSSGENADHMSYEVYADPDNCNAADASSGTSVASGADLSTGIGSTTTFDLTAGDGAAGTPVLLCFEVSASDDDFVQADTTEVIWEVTATSVDTP
ncbi:SipW-dependent-type signal peptide-containing protein [Nesterenkonia sp. HG001]|uniref:SipW-dependent-type signal peptide-containing protein n=1 Tax=Nesterenkonia sp. HG001 TaxID=2983207 RepID=UPI002AC6F6DD|nr:SipW-dependent-type signal peptide-containing protein [Nesterenkonia sp. HG001]MDZ5077447.1 SipW-dependent-type signal peptide-containing protein [Nesterenkonia sp. HG001]